MADTTTSKPQVEPRSQTSLTSLQKSFLLSIKLSERTAERFETSDALGFFDNALVKSNSFSQKGHIFHTANIPEKQKERINRVRAKVQKWMDQNVTVIQELLGNAWNIVNL